MESLLEKAMDGTLCHEDLAKESERVLDMVTTLLKELDRFEFLARVGLKENIYAKELSRLSEDAIEHLNVFKGRIYSQTMGLLTDRDV